MIIGSFLKILALIISLVLLPKIYELWSLEKFWSLEFLIVIIALHTFIILDNLVGVFVILPYSFIGLRTSRLILNMISSFCDKFWFAFFIINKPFLFLLFTKLTYYLHHIICSSPSSKSLFGFFKFIIILVIGGISHIRAIKSSWTSTSASSSTSSLYSEINIASCIFTLSSVIFSSRHSIHESTTSLVARFSSTPKFPVK